MLNKIPTSVWVVLTIVIGVGFLLVLVSSQGGRLSRNEEFVVNLAAEIGLDKQKFQDDLNSEAVSKVVEDQKNDVLERIGGTPSTPQVFINGTRLNLTVYTEIEAELKKAVEQAKSSETDNLNLPVLLEVFSDYNCPHCYNLEIYIEELTKNNAELMSNVDWQQKHLPFLSPTTSLLYARAAEAARVQGKFKEYNTLLFTRLHSK